jgi:AcrR family transcriptional regulator
MVSIPYRTVRTAAYSLSVPSEQPSKPPKRARRAASRVRLTRDDWTRAALLALADGGTAAVAVEPLAARLGATKGSFYWHFRDRRELLEAALETWERTATDDFIAELAAVADPVERLHRGFAMAMELEEDEHPDVRLLPSVSDPVVAPVAARVQQKRLRFLARTFREIGFPAAEARRRALLANSLYIGWFHQRLVVQRKATPRERRDYQRAAVELLTAR